MTIDERLEQLAGLEYPGKVDVVDRVMAEVSKKPYLRPVHRKVSWQRISAVAAAAAVLLVVVNIAVFHPFGYDDEGLGTMIAQVNDYSSWNTVEEAAYDDNPIAYLYDDYTE